MESQEIQEEQKVSSVYIPEKEFSKPQVGPEDRSFVRFDNANAVANTRDFKQLYFKVNCPTSESVLKNIFLVLPLRFRFRDRQGRMVSDRKIALKSDGLDRIFRSIRISMNGQFFNTIPFDRLHHEWVSPSLSYYEKVEGCLLPVSDRPDVKLPRVNGAWEERCEWFAKHKIKSYEKDVFDDAMYSYNDTFGEYFEIDLKLQLDTGPLTNYLRSQYQNVNTTLPYAYELDVT